MNGYICLKACTLGGIDYKANDDIPVEAVLPSRVRALTRQKYIALASTSSETPAGEQKPPQDEPRESAALVVVPIKTKDGWLELNMTSDDVIGAIVILQMNAEDAAETIKAIPNEEPLILLDVLEGRKTVTAAISERASELKLSETANPQSDDPNGAPAVMSK